MAELTQEQAELLTPFVGGTDGVIHGENATTNLPLNAPPSPRACDTCKPVLGEQSSFSGPQLYHPNSRPLSHFFHYLCRQRLISLRVNLRNIGRRVPERDLRCLESEPPADLCRSGVS